MPEIKEFKSLFETPKKARITVLCALVALITLGAVIVYIIYSLGSPGADQPPAQTEAVSGAPAGSDPPDETAGPTQNLMGIVPTLTIDEARALALENAGVDESEADVSREALSEDNGVWVYEFRFRTEKAQYEYKINANTGDVRSLVKETFVYPSSQVTEPPAPSPESTLPAETAPQPSAAVQPSNPPQPAQSAAPAATPAPAPSQSASKYIGVDRAKAIALDHAGLSASEVTFTHASMDREHGTMVYEIEFRQGWVEYEYEIDAASGTILSYDRDGSHSGNHSAASVSPPPAQSAPMYISTDQAKAIALSHAGLSASEVVFEHAGMDLEHGAMVYELEFHQGRVEYEYEIDAVTGQILDYERDVD